MAGSCRPGLEVSYIHIIFRLGQDQGCFLCFVFNNVLLNVCLVDLEIVLLLGIEVYDTSTDRTYRTLVSGERQGRQARKSKERQQGEY